MMAVVYKITNRITSKVYIGYTSLSVEDRWNQHKLDAFRKISNRKFYNAIRKYGTEVWDIETLLTTETVNEAKEHEIKYIMLHDSYNTGYNATRGGDGNNGIIMSEESNIKRSKALKGIPKSPETVEKFKQRRSTPEENAKRSASHKGMKKPWVKPTPEQIIKSAMTRRSLTEEQYHEIHKLRGQGKLIREISVITGISCDLIKKWLKREWELKL